jgi:phage terminase small subunit
MGKTNGKEKKPDGRKISRKLKPKQRKLVAHYTDPTKETFGNGRKAAIAAGYSESSATEIAYETLRKPHVQREIERVMEAGGLTREKIVGTLKSGLEAKITRVFCPQGMGGELVYSEPLEDHANQIRAAEVAGKLYGDFPSGREQDRMAALIFQQQIVVVPGGLPEPEEKAKKVRQLTD